MKRIIAAVAAVLSLSATAGAQTPPAWSSIPYPTMGNGSAACTHLGGQGDVFCFGLRCTAENAPEWFTHQVGGDSVEGEVRVNLIIDGKNHSTLFMQQGEAPQGEWSFTAPYDTSRDRSVVDQLKVGSGLYVMVGGATGAQLSLRGSSREIERVVAKCQAGGQADALAVNATATELTVTADQLPMPVRQEISQIAAMCGNAFLTEGRSPQALLAEDIDGDGTYDFLLDHAQFCPDAILTMCGASHCPLTLFVSAEGAWRRFDYILQGYKEFTAQGFLFQCSDPARKAGVFMEGGRLTERNCQ